MPAENDLGNIAALRVVRDELQRFGPPVVDISAAIEKVGPSVYQNLVNKYLAQPKQKVEEVGEIVKPLLLSLGYLKPDNLVDVARAWARAASRLSSREQAAGADRLKGSRTVPQSRTW